MKCAWQQCPNPEVNILHVTVRLPRVMYLDFAEDDDCELDEEDRLFVKSLRDVDGVVGVILHNYECQIEKGALFDWSEIRPAVIEVFRRRYKPHGKLVESSERPADRPTGEQR